MNRLTDIENKVRRGERQGRVGDSEAQTTRNKINTLQGYTAQGVQQVFYNNFKCSKILKNFETLCCIPETYVIKLRSLSFRLDREHVGSMRLLSC